MSISASTTILTLLANDHLTVKKWLKDLEKFPANAGKKRTDLFAKLQAMLTLHADFEEAHLYPILLQKKADRAQGLESLEEHVQVKRLLTELATLDPVDDVWKAKLTVLGENLYHHITEEEEEAFPLISKTASEEDLVVLGKAYSDEKRMIAVAS